MIHPGGGTYAARYAEKYPELRPKLAQYMHIKERTNDEGDELLASLQNMDDDAINALIAGASMFIEGKELCYAVATIILYSPKTYGRKTLQTRACLTD